MEITPDDLGALCMKVKKRGAPATAIIVRDIVKQVYGHAIMHGEKVANPAEEVSPASIATFTPKDRALSPAEIRLMMYEMDTVATLPTIRLALRMILLTLVRKVELLRATWGEVDFATGVWSIPKDRMKRRLPHSAAHARENAQAAMPCNVHKGPVGEVYKIADKVTMSDQNESKLNRLLAGLSDTGVVSSRWLRAHGYSSSLVVRYMDSGWLVSPARGVYMRKGGSLQWEGVVRTLQWAEGLSLHVGGRFALAWQGHEHYLRLGEAAAITLYGPDRLPGWVGKLPLTERVEYCGKGTFDLPALPFSDETTDQALLDQGLERREATPGGTLVCSTPERAMLELCDEASDASGVYEVDALMQGMATLRPQRLERLLRHCHSIKAKHLFLALAERHGHAWFSHLSLDNVNLGRGKRSLVPCGRLHPRYQITLPGDLDEQLG